METRHMNLDGSVEPLPWSRVERFTVRSVTSTDNPPAHHPSMAAYDTGTYALVTTWSASHNSLLKDVASFTAQYQVPPVVRGKGIGPKDPQGRHMAFRWSWERLTSWGGRVSDTLFVTVDSWS